MNKTCAVYIMTNYSETSLYIGVTSNLQKRVWEHKNKVVEGFTEKYNVNKLVYYEKTDQIKKAIAREKEIKGWSRAKKNKLVESVNQNWEDMSEVFW